MRSLRHISLSKSIGGCLRAFPARRISGEAPVSSFRAVHCATTLTGGAPCARRNLIPSRCISGAPPPVSFFGDEKSVSAFLSREFAKRELDRDQTLLGAFYEYCRAQVSTLRSARHHLWLGVLFRDGLYVMKSSRKALQHLSAAALRSSADKDAWFLLGHLYGDLALSSSIPVGCENLADLGDNSSPSKPTTTATATAAIADAGSSGVSYSSSQSQSPPSVKLQDAALAKELLRNLRMLLQENRRNLREGRPLQAVIPASAEGASPPVSSDSKPPSSSSSSGSSSSPPPPSPMLGEPGDPRQQLDRWKLLCRKRQLFCLFKAVEYGSADACVALGRLSQEREGIASEDARAWFSKGAAIDKNAAALYQLANIRVAVHGDAAGAIVLLRQAVSAHGCPRCALLLGQLLLQSQSLEADGGASASAREAVALIEQAAGEPHRLEEAMLLLSRMYAAGETIDKNEARAGHLLESAAQFCADATGAAPLEYGRYLYHRGDWRRAVQYFTVAAEEFDRGEAFLELAACHYHGHGTRRDRARAFQLYEEASTRNVVDAWLNLAQMWASGDGAPRRDIGLAEHFLRLYRQMSVSTES